MSIKITDKSKCNGCHACMSVCPKQCIQMEADKEGFWYPQVQADLCIECGMCERVCPVQQNREKGTGEPIAYVAVNKDDDIRRKSSSGGIFTLLAEFIIEQGGVVFGAAFSDDFKSVCHIAVQTKKELEKLRGSKYVQSNIGMSYIKAKKYLEQGRTILFTGTPCQIDGLLSFLNKEYGNLYTQDIICHGVPSPFIWKKYVELRETKATAETRGIFFRDKTYGWRSYSLSFQFAKNKKYIKKLSEDYYLQGFLRNLSLRPSCYQCASKGLNRKSDITLADFYGIEKIKPEIDDDKGTSLLLVHSEKGKNLLQEVQDRMQWVRTDVRQAIENNLSAVQSVKIPEKRKEFMCAISEERIEDVLKEYFQPPIGIRIKRNIRNVLSKVKRSILKKISNV